MACAAATHCGHHCCCETAAGTCDCCCPPRRLPLPPGTGTSFASWLHKGLLCQVDGPAHCCCLVDGLLVFTLRYTVSNKASTSLQINHSSSSVLGHAPGLPLSAPHSLHADTWACAYFFADTGWSSTEANTNPPACTTANASVQPVANSTKAPWLGVHAWKNRDRMPAAGSPYLQVYGPLPPAVCAAVCVQAVTVGCGDHHGAQTKGHVHAACGGTTRARQHKHQHQKMFITAGFLAPATGSSKLVQTIIHCLPISEHQSLIAC